MKYHSIPVRVAVIGKTRNSNHCKNAEKREPSCTSGGVDWCSHSGKKYVDSSPKLKVELLYDPAVPYLGIYLKKMKTLVKKGYINPLVHCNIIYSCQDMETTKCVSRNE